MPVMRPETQDHRYDVFAARYAVNFNATEAAIEAGANPKAAKQTGHRWLQLDVVKKKVRAILAVRTAQADLDAEHVLGQYKAIALADITDVVSWCNEVTTSEDGKTVVLRGVVFSKPSHELPPHVRAAIKSVKQTANGIEVVMHDKGGSLEKLEAYLRMEGAVKKHMLVGHDGGALQATTRVIIEVVDPANPAPDNAGEE
ncbi:terminase small subunit [Thalassobaculum sp.]|uniref:terminase small subunit n=1 Tax=Thalassobaculum sp. TaxID=2022740 RepID=UPI0032ED830F